MYRKRCSFVDQRTMDKQITAHGAGIFVEEKDTYRRERKVLPYSVHARPIISGKRKEVSRTTAAYADVRAYPRVSSSKISQRQHIIFLEKKLCPCAVDMCSYTAAELIYSRIHKLLLFFSLLIPRLSGGADVIQTEGEKEISAASATRLTDRENVDDRSHSESIVLVKHARRAPMSPNKSSRASCCYCPCSNGLPIPPTYTCSGISFVRRKALIARQCNEDEHNDYNDDDDSSTTGAYNNIYIDVCICVCMHLCLYALPYFYPTLRAKRRLCFISKGSCAHRSATDPMEIASTMRMVNSAASDAAAAAAVIAVVLCTTRLSGICCLLASDTRVPPTMRAQRRGRVISSGFLPLSVSIAPASFVSRDPGRLPRQELPTLPATPRNDINVFSNARDSRKLPPFHEIDSRAPRAVSVIIKIQLSREYRDDFIAFDETSSPKINTTLRLSFIFFSSRLVEYTYILRATLAEKEVSVLKEQLASASANDTANVKTEGSNNAQSIDQNQNQDSSTNRRTPNANHEQELQAKDREIPHGRHSWTFSTIFLEIDGTSSSSSNSGCTRVNNNAVYIDCACERLPERDRERDLIGSRSSTSSSSSIPAFIWYATKLFKYYTHELIRTYGSSQPRGISISQARSRPRDMLILPKRGDACTFKNETWSPCPTIHASAPVVFECT
ncbi:unnamed protein product [Trichogramma brassicae]|uniref:Uncharacterized protein n=1 Tax=Trichogramma brassicae TaxID=86971 RepID=A0A6H5J080_9HYME|nr:unnamed protein product [Trichogramma brassicae]